MDREDIAEMSCIAGVGGDVKSLVKTAKCGRPIIAIDGCPLACTKNCLARHDVQPIHHFDLSNFTVVKKKGENPDLDVFRKTYERIVELI